MRASSFQCRSSLTSRPTLRKISTLLIGVALLLAQAAPAKAANNPAPDPTPLWRAFPLRGVEEKRQPRAVVGPPARSQPADQPRGDSVDSPNGATERAVLTIALAGGVLAVLLLMYQKHLRGTKRGVVSLSGFIRRDSASVTEEVDKTERLGASRLNEALTSYSLSRPHASESETEHDDAGGTAHPNRGDRRLIGTYELGPTTANVHGTVEREAAQVLSAAQADAPATRETAESEARAQRPAFDGDTAGRRWHLTQNREEVDRYAEELRREADAEEQRLREECEAVKLRLEEEVRARRQELVRASRVLDDHLRLALSGVQGVVAELQDLLAEQPPELEEELLREVQDVTGEVESRRPRA